jgi:protein involved in polysaccharide export with SLBB domain
MQVNPVNADHVFVHILRLMAIAAVLMTAACGDSDTTPVRDDAQLSSISMSQQASLTTSSQSIMAADSDRGPNYQRESGGPDDYKLGANDKLRIIVFGQEKLTGEFLLDGNAALAFPLIGSVSASGITVKELERKIAGKLDPDFVHSPSVSVEVLSRRPFFVVGEVQKPGSYPHTSQLNVLSAVATAGGYTYRARHDLYYLKRTDIEGRLYRVRATAETIVRPGDVVEVKERSF